MSPNSSQSNGQNQTKIVLKTIDGQLNKNSISKHDQGPDYTGFIGQKQQTINEPSSIARQPPANSEGHSRIVE